MPGAVQELLRYCGPIVSAMVRYVVEDVNMGDILMERGDRVQVVLAAANHDPRQFDDPDRLDVTRRPDGAGVQHLAYSYGAHYCLGAVLANQEAEVALAALLARYRIWHSLSSRSAWNGRPSRPLASSCGFP